MEYKRICSECGKEFETNFPNGLTCSPECSKKRHIRITAEWGKKKRAQGTTDREEIECFCAHCGKSFRAIWERKYCSDECRTARNKTKKKKIKPDFLGAKLSNLSEAGISYAEYQKRDTLSRVEPIDLNVGGL